MVRVFDAVRALLQTMPILSEAEAANLGMYVADEQQRRHASALLHFLAKARFSDSDLTRKQLDSIDCILSILNVAPNRLVHVCVPGCTCTGKPVRLLLRSFKVFFLRGNQCRI